jgi:ribosomal protein S18 acetylase RimI-like enzyme
MKIRKADIKDAELLVELGCKTFYDTYHEQNTVDDMEQYLSANFTLQHIKEEILDASNDFYVAEKKEEVTGYIKISESATPKEISHLKSLEIAKIYTLKNVHGKGVGTLLLHKAFEIAKQREKDAVWLCVWQKNDKAIRFYKKHGFVIIAKASFVLGTDVQDDWIMAKYFD